MSKKFVYCESCDRKFPRDELKWDYDWDADEVKVYVVLVGLCPYCYDIVEREFLYEAPDPDEPLRHEM